MKIIHCADLHIDSPMASLPRELASRRREELLVSFRRVVDYAVENDVQAVIIAGDLYDRRKPSASSVKAVMSIIESNSDIAFYYLKGNHDSEELYDKALLPDNLKLFGDTWATYYLEDSEGGSDSCRITITGMEIGPDNKLSAGNVPCLDMRDFNITVLHGEAGENSQDINLKYLRNLGIDYLALGHIHSYRYEQLDKRGAYCYCGCLESRGFDEADSHGFVVLDIDTKNNSYISELVDLSVRKVDKFTVDISDCLSGGEILSKAIRLIGEAQIPSDDMVLIELCGTVDISCDKNIYMIEQYFANNYYMARVHDKSDYRVNYEDYALDESLKGEFVRSVYASTELSEEQKAEVIRIGIKALRGEDFDI